MVKIALRNLLGALDDAFHPKTFIQYWFPALAWAALIFLLSSIPQLPTGLPHFWDALFKKTGHIFEYFVLTFLVWRIFYFGYRFSSTDSMALAAVFSTLYAATDEIHQLFVRGRHGRLTDFLIDILGIALFGLFLRYFYNNKKKRAHS